MAGLPNFKPVVKGNRPYFEAKLKDGAIPSVAAFTGTTSSAAVAIAGATGPQVAAALGQLLIDLRARGVIS